MGAAPETSETFAYFENKQGLLIFIEAILAPIFEEWIFRGLIFGKLRFRISYVWAALISAGTFAILHWDILQSIYAFIFGLILCEAMMRGRQLYISIFMHMMANVFAIMVNYIEPVNTFLTDNVILMTVVSGILFIGFYMLFVHETGGYKKERTL